MHTPAHTFRLLFAGLALASTVFAQSGDTGALTGRVSDAATNLALSGARVSVQGTRVETYTDHAGNYTLTGLAPGNWTIEISYVGYGELEKTATVETGLTRRVDGVFNSKAIEMERFVIDGRLVGQARAVNEQRAALSLSNIVASDEIGSFPDQNAAESLQRIPGVSLYRDQGEGRFVDLRGLNYVYTSVNLNGARIASPELGDRAIALDVVPSDSLSMLEVTKAPTPDMDAEGLGGSINLKTRSAFDSTGRRITIGTQGLYSNLRGAFGAKASVSYSDLFNNDTVGVLLDLTWQNRLFGSYNFEEDGLYSERSFGSDRYLALNNLGFRDYVVERKRYGGNVALEFHPSDQTKIFFRTTYNNFTDTEDRHQLFLPFEKGTATAISENGLSVNKFVGFRRDIRIRKKEQELTAFTTGFEKRVSEWILDGMTGYSVGRELRPEELTVRFTRSEKDIGLSYETPSLYNIIIKQDAGASISDPASYNKLDRIETKNDSGRETEVNAAINLTRKFEGTQTTTVKAGLSARQKKKTADENVSRWKAPSSFTFANLADIVSDYPYGPTVPRLSHDKVLAAFNGSRSSFTETVQTADSLLGDFDSEEQVLAAYAMGKLTLGKTSVLAGVRAERTEFDTEGWEYREPSASKRKVSRTYDKILPGLHLRHDLSRKMILRASYTESLMRPNFSDSTLSRNIADNDEEVSAGNPFLDPLQSRNLDVSAEYYLPSLGLVSVAAFSKKVENFSYEITIPGGDPSLPDYDLITYRNGSDGDIKGVEFAYQQQLRMLPAPFEGVGVLANLTLVDSSASYPTRAGDSLPFIGQSDRTGNLALTYEKGGFSARLAMNFRSEHLREDEPIGGDSTEDRWIDAHRQLDLSLSYDVSRNAQLFVEATNLTNEPFRVYVKGTDGKKRLVQFEEYEMSASFGVRFRL